ncbi:LysR family transcriptional regulator [Mesorhizobium sp. Root157]|uniref:LysR substrate-binding domain-containing protein n=1 Tax=Mesorhizobium sp. Root157 TaxID=1736477 RepID=UPI0006F7A244|nr:LysR substrate-binding domain-containing protein [Mesorhizobium sp. Root157]KQZ96595.1 LysR family transcriptional regulator [Mesorhizobium sp. Root157]
MISLKQLKYFDAVARCGHFGKAAEQCAVTQPALSMQIQELEKFLEVQLFERGRGSVMLTSSGRSIALRAARILSEARDIVDLARQDGKSLSGPLGLGVIPSVAPYVLPRLLPSIRHTYPDLDLRLRETQTQFLLRELLDGSLDLLLLALPVDDPAIETLRLFDDRFLLAMPQSKRISNHVRATPDMVESDKLLLLEEGHCFRDQALTFCGLRQVENAATFGVSSLSTLLEMVTNGFGMTLIPEISVGVETKRGNFHLMRFEDPEPKRVIGLAWRKSSPRKRDFIELGEVITASTKQLRKQVAAHIE